MTVRALNALRMSFSKNLLKSAKLNSTGWNEEKRWPPNVAACYHQRRLRNWIKSLNNALHTRRHRNKQMAGEHLLTTDDSVAIVDRSTAPMADRWNGGCTWMRRAMKCNLIKRPPHLELRTKTNDKESSLKWIISAPVPLKFRPVGFTCVTWRSPSSSAEYFHRIDYWNELCCCGSITCTNRRLPLFFMPDIQIRLIMVRTLNEGHLASQKSEC